jgi:arsenite oxidase small subunit
MKRRDFVGICAMSATGAAGMSLAPAATAAPLTARSYARAKLIDERGAPVRIAALTAGANYVFDYPYAATPCFLLRLDRPVPGGVELRTEAGAPYRWEGGVGEGKSVVAYSAICAHKMAYPTKQVSFIAYRDGPSPVAGPGKVITCCSDRSVYDPASGARVVSGPAPQPLATILLEHDPRADELFAVGTFGGEKFDEFFQKYEFRLQLEMGNRARAGVEGTAVVRPLEHYSIQWARC